MMEYGYSVSRDNVGNIIGHIGSGTPIILLCGHMDTIPIRLNFEQNNEIIFGRGAVDAKAALAALIMAGKMVHETNFNGTLLVAAVVQEEGDNRGVKAIINAGLKSDYAIFGEPTNSSSISIGYKGRLVFSITCLTSYGHSSAPGIFRNAIDEIIKLYFYLKKDLKKILEEKNDFTTLSLTIREIHGGKNIGANPDKCKAVIELRLPPKFNVKITENIIKEKIDRYSEENKETLIEYDFIDGVDPILTNKNNLLIKGFSRTIYNKKKKTVSLLKKSGTSDMNYYGNFFETPIVTYGPGDPHLSHTNNEHIEIKEYLESIEILKNTITYLGLNHNP